MSNAPNVERFSSVWYFSVYFLLMRKMHLCRASPAVLVFRNRRHEGNETAGTRDGRGGTSAARASRVGGDERRVRPDARRWSYPERGGTLPGIGARPARRVATGCVVFRRCFPAGTAPSERFAPVVGVTAALTRPARRPATSWNSLLPARYPRDFRDFRTPSDRPPHTRPPSPILALRRLPPAVSPSTKDPDSRPRRAPPRPTRAGRPSTRARPPTPPNLSPPPRPRADTSGGPRGRARRRPPLRRRVPPRNPSPRPRARRCPRARHTPAVRIPPPIRIPAARHTHRRSFRPISTISTTLRRRVLRAGRWRARRRRRRRRRRDLRTTSCTSPLVTRDWRRNCPKRWRRIEAWRSITTSSWPRRATRRSARWRL